MQQYKPVMPDCTCMPTCAYDQEACCQRGGMIIPVQPAAPAAPAAQQMSDIYRQLAFTETETWPHSWGLVHMGNIVEGWEEYRSVLASQRLPYCGPSFQILLKKTQLSICQLDFEVSGPKHNSMSNSKSNSDFFNSVTWKWKQSIVLQCDGKFQAIQPLLWLFCQNTWTICSIGRQRAPCIEFKALEYISCIR